MIGSFYRSSFQTSHKLKCPGHCGYCILTVRYIGYTSRFSWQWILKLVFWDVTPYSLVGRYVSTFRETYIPDYMVSYQNTVVLPCIFTSQPLPLIASINAFWKLKQLFNPKPNLYVSTPLLSALMLGFVRTSCVKYCTFPYTHNSGHAFSSQIIVPYWARQQQCNILADTAFVCARTATLDEEFTEKLCKYPHNPVKQVWNPDTGQYYKPFSDANDI